MPRLKPGDFDLTPLGDSVLMIELGSDASEQTAARVHAVAEHLQHAPLVGVRDVVAAACTVALHYDLLLIETPSEDVTPFDALAQRVAHSLQSFDASATPALSEFEIPVCYGGEFGEDLEEVARTHELSTDEVVALHAGVWYRVQMLGFAPGFAYLAGLDPRIVTPRRSSPRTRVPAGSVGIGGELTGVYPQESPGGWRLIGRTPLRMFDPARARPSLLTAGDRVRFVAIGAGDYARLQRGEPWR